MLLKNLLMRNRALMPTWNNHLFSNHLSMSLIALFKMGADEKKLQNFFDHHINQYIELNEETALKIDTKTWKKYLGEGDNVLQPFLQFFQQQKDQTGDFTKFLKEWLPHLIPGLAAHLFHGMIRLGFALEIGDEDDAVLSLAYWASRYVHFMEPEGEAKSSEEIFAQLQENKSFLAKGLSNPVSSRQLPEIAANSAFQVLLRPVSLGPKDQPLKNIAESAIQTYASSGNFLMLHVVTGCYALRLLLHLLSQSDQMHAINQMWTATCTVYIAAQCPHPLNVFPSALMSWDEIRNKVMSSYDDHEIKMVYVCWREFEMSKNRLYQYAAQQIVRNIRPPGKMWGT